VGGGLKIPNLKIQIPNKHQEPKLQIPKHALRCGFVWNLELGIGLGFGF
jgi:hypothetical protein